MEIIDNIFANKEIRVEKIQSHGEISPNGYWYNQDEGEFVYIVQGEGELTFKSGEIIRLTKGEHHYIEPHCQHRVSYTSNDCEWLCVFVKVGD